MAVGRLLYVATIARTHTSHLAPVAERLVSRGWEIDGVANGLSEVARALPYEAIFDVPWTRQLSRVDAALRSWRPIQRIVRDGRYDVVHVHTPFASWITRMANRRSVGRGQAMVYTAHGFHFHEHGSRVKNLIFRSAEKLAGRFTTILTVMNDEDLSAATRHRLVPAGHVLQTPGIGIDFARLGARLGRRRKPEPSAAKPWHRRRRSDCGLCRRDESAQATRRLAARFGAAEPE